MDTSSAQRFCILTMDRSGSNLLCAILHSTPRIVCHRELFHQRKQHFSFDPSPELTRTNEERDQDPLGFLSEVERLSVARHPDAEAVGFKLFLVHNDTVLHHVVRDPAYRIVVLRRENLLAQYSSRLLAEREGRWTRRAGESRPSETVEFDRDGFEAFRQAMDGHYSRLVALLDEHRKSYYALEYLDVKSPDAISDLLSFIGVSYHGDPRELMARVRLTKQNPAVITERFSDPERVETAMRSAGAEAWLVEDGGSGRPDAGLQGEPSAPSPG